MTTPARPAGARRVVANIALSLWTLRQSTATESGALCLLYDQVREGN